MSTDQDVMKVQLHESWPEPPMYYSWPQITKGGIGIRKDDALVVVAHGNNNSIGNAHDNTVDINPATFLDLIKRNMEKNRFPSFVYIWACSKNIAEFAAHLANLAKEQGGWENTKFFGTRDPVSGNVPPPDDMVWTQINVIK